MFKAEKCVEEMNNKIDINPSQVFRNHFAENDGSQGEDYGKIAGIANAVQRLL